MKPSLFYSTRIEDVFEFIIDCYERIHKVVIMQQHGIEFMTFQLQKDAKKWWRSYVECQSPIFLSLTWLSFTLYFLETYVPHTLGE